MEDEKQPDHSVDHSTDQDHSNMPFKPAANPFENSAETPPETPPAQPVQPQPVAPPPQQPEEPKKKSGLNYLGFGNKKDKPRAYVPQTTEAVINGRPTILVGHVPEQENGVQQQPTIPEEVLFSWRAPEFVYTKKPAGWYIGLGAIVLVLVGLAVWAQQWIAIVLLLVMGVGVAIWANRKPRELEYKLSNYGVYVDQKRYLFENFRGFYTFMDYNQKTLDLIPGKNIGTLVSLPLVGMESEVVEETIARMVPKIDHHEDAIDKLFRKLRF